MAVSNANGIEIVLESSILLSDKLFAFISELLTAVRKIV